MVLDEIVFATQEDVEAFLTLDKVSDSISFHRLVFHILICIIILIIFPYLRLEVTHRSGKCKKSKKYQTDFG